MRLIQLGEVGRTQSGTAHSQLAGQQGYNLGIGVHRPDHMIAGVADGNVPIVEQCDALKRNIGVRNADQSVCLPGWEYDADVAGLLGDKDVAIRVHGKCGWLVQTGGIGSNRVAVWIKFYDVAVGAGILIQHIKIFVGIIQNGGRCADAVAGIEERAGLAAGQI